MTGSGGWSTGPASGRWSPESARSSVWSPTDGSISGCSSTVGFRNGWQWSFQVRTAGQSGSDLFNGGLNGGQSEHPARRSRKLARLEAVLLVADGALSFHKLAQFATLADAAEARRLVEELNDKLDLGGAAFRIEKVATGVRMMTRPQFSMWLDRLHNRQARARLSPPMLETLSIVAYRQPVTRADVEKIRGVQASEMLRQLMDRGLVRITGEDDSLGRPFLYGTTRQFLEEYGFGSLDDLPMAETLRRRDEPQEVPEPAADADEPDEGSSDAASQLDSDESDEADFGSEVEVSDEHDIDADAELNDEIENDEIHDEWDDEDEWDEGEAA